MFCPLARQFPGSTFPIQEQMPRDPPWHIHNFVGVFDANLAPQTLI